MGITKASMGTSQAQTYAQTQCERPAGKAREYREEHMGWAEVIPVPATPD